ncbi:excisionase family DNA-binding protein [Candidatus Protofrankia californiensis]|uniref:excisionase family DNA-binding protein n=1 Tax=Candidatus Protofrankia californiensis TaxID=1839754 RepID=UPI0010418437|nr:excisionase family DNA-binding protein [Candidatus Protofrankia californiensis]
MTKLLLTPVEAAESLAVSRSTVYELLAVGVLESVYIGRSRRIPRAALDAYVDRLRGGCEGRAA